MKNILLKSVLLFIIPIAVFYLGFSFCKWDFNPQNWGESLRLLFCILSIPLSAFLGLLPFLNENEL